MNLQLNFHTNPHLDVGISTQMQALFAAMRTMTSNREPTNAAIPICITDESKVALAFRAKTKGTAIVVLLTSNSSQVVPRGIIATSVGQLGDVIVKELNTIEQMLVCLP